jgi:hypothetical protein
VLDLCPEMPSPVPRVVAVAPRWSCTIGWSVGCGGRVRLGRAPVGVTIEMVEQVSPPVADRTAKADEFRPGPGGPVALHRPR